MSDLIRRGDVEEALQGLHVGDVRFFEKLRKTLDEIPSAEPERTAKVQELPRRSETSLDWEGICSNCGSYTNRDMNYCFECGAKLDWSDDENA